MTAIEPHRVYTKLRATFSITLQWIMSTAPKLHGKFWSFHAVKLPSSEKPRYQTQEEQEALWFYSWGEIWMGSEMCSLTWNSFTHFTGSHWSTYRDHVKIRGEVPPPFWNRLQISFSLQYCSLLCILSPSHPEEWLQTKDDYHFYESKAVQKVTHDMRK